MIWFQKKEEGEGVAWSGGLAWSVARCRWGMVRCRCRWRWLYIEHWSGGSGWWCTADLPDWLGASVNCICTLNTGPWTTVNGAGTMSQNIGISTGFKKRRFWRDDAPSKDLTTDSRQNIGVFTAILEVAKGTFQIWTLLGFFITRWVSTPIYYTLSVKAYVTFW